MPRRESRLKDETSPYLLQHATNPVDWHPWSEEALRLAKETDKPILLSIGYSACHWCHVMAHESFENDAIAARMNEGFICIKVDREERPDLDDIYMTATVALSGAGGWPMTVFLTPNGEPFFAGTYFPPEDRGGRPGFSSLLNRISELWKTDRKGLFEQAAQLTTHVKQTYELPRFGAVSEDSLRGACRALAREFDESFGGFGGAPKFPAPGAISLLLRAHRRTGNPQLLSMATRTLDGMMSGGMLDHLGGGFARYSVDQAWLVPHFEKMLYDNAQLADVYTEAFQATGQPSYRRVARETLNYLLREMQSPSGGFFSSSDADSEGVEGRFFVFDKAEVQKAIGEPAATHFCEFYGITEDGNFEGKNVLSMRRSLADVAKSFGIDQGALSESLEEGRAALLSYRSQRVAPDVDDKILVSWNGLTIRALANAARAFGDTRYLEAARRAADYILESADEGEGMRRKDGGLFRVARSGRAHIEAYLEDYAFLAEGLLALYEAGGGEAYLSRSVELAERMLTDFGGSESEPLFLTPNQGESLVARPRSAADGAVPSANAIACLVLAKLAAHLDRPAWQKRAENIAGSYATPLKRTPRAYCSLLCAVDFLLESPLEVVIAGDPDDENIAELSAAIASRYLPNRIETRLGSAPLEPSPLTAGRFQTGAPAFVHLCQNFVCQKPISDAAELRETLLKMDEAHREGRTRELGANALHGRATSEDTKRHAAASGLPASAFTQLGALTVSRIGLGTHRIGLDHSDHRAALRHALLSGINLIDTSPTFAFGDSERVIGQVISELLSEGKTKRSALVLVSKVGVALGSAAEELEERRKKGNLSLTCAISPADKKAAEKSALSLSSGAFCLEPAFLQSQLQSSLARLGVAHLDVCLLQSPEHFLAAGKTREELEHGILGAFSLFEDEVRAGRISGYGILSNTLARAATDSLSLSIENLVAIAKQAGGDSHHFTVVELPLSAGESDALKSEGKKSALQLAQENKLAVLACRPLSPFVNGALLRLVEPPASKDGATAASLKAARYRVASLEAEFETTFAAQLRVAGKVGPEAVLPLSGPLGQALEHAQTREQFVLAETTMVTPRLRHLIAQIDRAFAGPGQQTWEKFREQYVRAIGHWLAAVHESAKDKNRVLLQELEATLPSSDEFGPQLRAGFSSDAWLERALGLVIGAAGVTSALVGLRHPDHVDAALTVLRKS